MKTRLQQSINLLIAFLLITSTNSCKKVDTTEPLFNNGIVVEQTNVKTFEIVNLIANVSLSENYIATFGSATIKLFKTSDSTLMFIVPQVLEGAATLEFELAKVNFNVTHTKVINADQIATSIFENFDAKVSLMNSSTPQEIEDINSLKLFKKEVLGLFNALSAEEKMENALFYEANKDMFNTFLAIYSSRLDATTQIKRSGSQSACPVSDYKSRGICTAENIAKTADELHTQLQEADFINKMSSKWLSGTYLVMAGVAPNIRKLRTNLAGFLNETWILDDAIFNKIETLYTHNVFKKMNLNAELRTINYYKDAYFLNRLDGGYVNFFNTIAGLSTSWGEFELLGSFPEYVDLKEAVGISYKDINITNISNSNVKFPPELAGEIEPYVKFKSLSGNEENFNYKITVSLEGFLEEKTVTGKVLAVDSTEIYRTSALGSYTVNGYVGNGPNSRLYCELKTGGVATYTIYDDPSWPNGKAWDISWTIKKQNGKYYYLDYWWNNFPDIKIDSPLSLPVLSFDYHQGSTYTK